MEVIRNSKPIVLEPIVEIEILGPRQCHRRSDRRPFRQARSRHRHRPRGGMTAITGQVPLAELNDYQSRLKSLTGGQGSYSLASAITRRCRRTCSSS